MRRVDLGSVVVPVLDGTKLRLTFGPGDELVAAALVGRFGEIEVRAHAAPKSGRADLGGQWRGMLSGLAEELNAAGLRLSYVDGMWGRELVAEGDRTYHRLLGREGERWTLVVVAAGALAHAETLTALARDVLAGAQARRGDDPQPANALLPLRIVDHSALGEWERAELAEPERLPADLESLQPPFPDPDAIGAKGSAMQQLRSREA